MGGTKSDQWLCRTPFQSWDPVRHTGQSTPAQPGSILCKCALKPALKHSCPGKFLLTHFQPALVLRPSTLHEATTSAERTGPAALTVCLLSGPRSQAAEPCRIDGDDSPTLCAGPAPSRAPWRPDHITSHTDSLTSKPNRKNQIPSFGIYLAWSHDSIPYSRSESKQGCSPQAEALFRGG